MLQDVPRDFEDFYARYRPVIRRIIQRLSRHKVRGQDMDDLIQHVFLQALVRRWLERYDASRSGFGTFVTTLTHNALVNYFRSVGRTPLNNPYGFLDAREPRGSTNRPRPERTIDAENWAPTAPFLRDDTFEARLLRDLDINRFRAAVAATTSCSQAIAEFRGQVLELLAQGCTMTETAAQFGTTTSRVIQARRAMRALARAR